MNMFEDKEKNGFSVDEHYKIICRSCQKEIPSHLIEKHTFEEHLSKTS